MASCAAFVGILRLALSGRREQPRAATVLWVAAIVVVGGMLFAKTGTSLGLPVAVYYGVPAILTWVFPPLVFRMRGREIARYLPMAMGMAPAIHALFSFFLGWNEYMPFIPIPSLHSLLGSA